ncbi:MAG: universal stress protein [Thermoanaerobacter sp.]|nr:universal stress protein [Thermoanaerobacter sp.]
MSRTRQNHIKPPGSSVSNRVVRHVPCPVLIVR